MPDRIMVPFEGNDAGVDELSWGQLEIWLTMRRQQSWLPVSGVRRVLAGTTLDDVVAELRSYLSRHQSMRTRLRFGPTGLPRQVVARSGEAALEVVDAAADADPDQVAERVERRFREADYDFVHEWPVRMAAVRQCGVVTHVVIVLCHLTVDRVGAVLMTADHAKRDFGTRDAPLPESAMPPLAQVRWQRSPAGQRQCVTALRYWEKVLRTIPPRRFRGSDDHRRPRFWEGGFESPAMFLALRAIAARSGDSGSSPLLGGFAIALKRMTGINPVVVQPVVSNRFRPGLADTVSPINQTGLCVIDVADGTTTEEAFGRAGRAAIRAYKHAYYDPVQLEELVARVGRERGEELDLACFFNDRRPPDRRLPALPRPLAGADLRAARSRGSFRWLLRQNEPFERMFLHVEDAPDAIQLTINIDTHYVSPADAETCLREMEAVMIAAADHPANPVRVPETTPAPDHQEQERTA